MRRSIIEYHAEHEGYKCGYCKKPNTNFSHGIWVHNLTVTDYQSLIDRGWRRSGKYCYKPTMDVTCCPLYTIRCRIKEFKLTKSQKKVCKKFNKFIQGNLVETSKESGSGDKSDDVPDEKMALEQFIESNKTPREINMKNVKAMAFRCSQDDQKQDIGSTSKKMEVEKHMDAKDDASMQVNANKGAGPNPAKGPCRKAKQLRHERKLEKLREKGIDISTLTNDTQKNTEKTIEDFINELPGTFKDKLKLCLVRTNPVSPEWIATAKESYELYVKYQVEVHHDRPSKCTEPKFTDFLVNSPLLEEYSAVGPKCGYGSFHQQYWIENKLVAVGVIDILPKCVSSVYFFYDPAYANLTMGTYGALREIAFTRQLNLESKNLKYYYMGFYIHSCPKMRYKGNFHPSDLLCPETYKWFPLEQCLPKIELSPYSRLNPDLDGLDEDAGCENDLNDIPIYCNGRVELFASLKTKHKNKSNEELMQYMKLVGAQTAKRMIYVK